MSSAEQVGPWSTDDHVPAAELARRQGITPLRSAEDLAVPGLFEDDAEYDAFLSDLYASRRADVG